MFNNKTILITGGTGSFGKTFVTTILSNYNPKKVIIFSRDEMKQWEMEKKLKNHPNVRFFIGDVKDKERLHRALDLVDFVVHAAATKIVPKAELDPLECIKTNIIGAANVIDVCIDRKVKKVVALSTDKASSPVNLYGATKLVADKLFTAGNVYSRIGSREGDKKSYKTSFSVVRYGNVMGSRGSVIPFFKSILPPEKIPITDPRMTRFMISLEEGVNLVIKAFEDMLGGEIYVKKIPSMNIVDVAKTISPLSEHKIVGIRAGEKLHEQMIGPEDALTTYEYDDYFKILPFTLKERDIEEFNKRIKKGVLVEDGFTYCSDNNNEWMTKSQLRNWLDKNSENLENY